MLLSEYSQIYTSVDLANRYQSRYIPAKITLVAVNAAAIVVSSVLRVIYGIRNSTADRLGIPARSKLEAQLAKGQAASNDQDFVEFRYVY